LLEENTYPGEFVDQSDLNFRVSILVQKWQAGEFLQTTLLKVDIRAGTVSAPLLISARQESSTCIIISIIVCGLVYDGSLAVIHKTRKVQPA